MLFYDACWSHCTCCFRRENHKKIISRDWDVVTLFATVKHGMGSTSPDSGFFLYLAIYARMGRIRYIRVQETD
jgi:hypothetical protein